MFGYMNRDESHTSNIWDEEREEVGEGMDEEKEEEEKEEEEGSSLPKRGLRDWKWAMQLWEQSHKTQGSFLNLCQPTSTPMEEAHQGSLHPPDITHSGSIQAAHHPPPPPTLVHVWQIYGTLLAGTKTGFGAGSAKHLNKKDTEC